MALRQSPALPLAAVMGALLAVVPAAAQYRNTQPETPATTRPQAKPGAVEEVIVTAPRRTLPNYQEFDAFQRAEFEKIRERFETPGPLEPRGDQVLSTSVAEGPNDASYSSARSAIQQAPRLRDTVSNRP